VKRATAAELGRRVSRLEEARPAGPLSASEAAELRALDAWYDDAFDGHINDWSDEPIRT
jgi:hypothetical protein